MKRCPKDLYDLLQDVLNWSKTSAIDSVYHDEQMLRDRIESVLSTYKPYAEPFKFDDLTGQTFSEIYVLKYIPEQKRFWCRCSCGVEKLITGHQLKIGRTKSCGHLKRTAGGKYARQSANNPTNKKST